MAIADEVNEIDQMLRHRMIALKPFLRAVDVPFRSWYRWRHGENEPDAARWADVKAAIESKLSEIGR